MMVSGWQLWLSPRPLRRTVFPSERHILSAHNAALFEFLEHDDGRTFIRETHYVDNKVVRDGLSGPPLHIHLLQSEYFEVEKGVIGIHRNGQDLVVTKDDGIVKVPAGTRHRFWAHASSQEDLVFKVWAEPQGLDHGFDEKFVRNLVGYQRDCQEANLEPSVLQLILFACGSATVATPPFWVPIWILKLVNYVLAYGIGVALLGYEESYPEYSMYTLGQHFY
ncbi:hypothetical protein F4677DRAFT_415280 [Hypoxylon crocopeplum]|nr:hypothetical protein F4677DRAFT_415280 [Hypoxylon crocopeplum]